MMSNTDEKTIVAWADEHQRAMEKERNFQAKISEKQQDIARRKKNSGSCPASAQDNL